MKKLMLIMLCICLCSGVGLTAMEKGTFTVGGSLSYQNVKFSSTYQDRNYNYLVLGPRGGYFVTDNLCLDLTLGYSVGWESGEKSYPGYNVGIGARYFINRFYGGFEFELDRQRNILFVGGPEDYRTETYWTTQKEAIVKAGYMLPVAKNIYADLGVYYRFGLGKYTNSHSTMTDYDNDFKKFGTSVGIDVFIK